MPPGHGVTVPVALLAGRPPTDTEQPHRTEDDRHYHGDHEQEVQRGDHRRDEDEEHDRGEQEQDQFPHTTTISHRRRARSGAAGR